MTEYLSPAVSRNSEPLYQYSIPAESKPRSSAGIVVGVLIGIFAVGAIVCVIVFFVVTRRGVSSLQSENDGDDESAFKMNII